jgi:putative hydrolase
VSVLPPLTPVAALERIAFLLERGREPTYRVKAFRGAAATIGGLSADEVAARAAAGTLRELPGIGEVTERVVIEALAGRRPEYLARLEDEHAGPLVEGGDAIRAALRGDCHTHSDWSDGGSPIEEMALAAREIDHAYIVLTDHSGRLKVAKGLDRDRLLRQLDVVAELNERLAPFRILTGMEVDILEDGDLDMGTEVLSRLDVVVGSVHSKLRMEERPMTARMVAAVANPDLDILGHCTGRIVVGRGRPESTFDAELVSPPASGSTRPSRSTAGLSDSTRRSGCCGWPWRGAVASASTPTPTLPVSWSGSRTGACAPPSARCRSIGSSTR